MNEPAFQEKRGERIAKVISRAGLCSRREAERWIADGRVAVNGKTIDGAALNVTAADRITVDGAALPQADATRLWRFHKPTGLVTTARDPQGRPTVFDALPADLPRLISVGRLDINTEGLLLLTNDGALARRLELPATGWVRRYRVRVHGHTDEMALTALAQGITVYGVEYGPIKASYERPPTGSNAWLVISLTEGKNREVRNVMRHLGLTVNRLIRTAYGPFQLGNLAAGAVEEVEPAVLADQLGLPASAPRHKGWAKPKGKPGGKKRAPRNPKGSRHADHRRR